ncbi:hypothetical protein GCM10009821_14890 [Aeromicrobium halocynthiae]|uniref:3'(2'),5'-bisphosphate nucleotidase CysQ n=1 Tax=Aeromicrobium halocynthiae TaxID=560557 RepID=A0ABN2VXS7_9ACTN
MSAIAGPAIEPSARAEAAAAMAVALLRDVRETVMKFPSVDGAPVAPLGGGTSQDRDAFIARPDFS